MAKERVVKVLSRKFGVVEVAFMVTLAVLAGALLAPGQRPVQTPVQTSAAAWLEQRYGPGKNSQHLEEWIVRDHFADRRGGTFVDVGAAHYKQLSNTWFLDSELGWSGLAVDAQREFAAEYATYRPRTVFRTFFVSDTSSEHVTLFLNEVPWVASSTPDFTRRWGELQHSRQVETITLNDLLRAENMDAFDFLSMDIELAEPKALAGLDLARFHPELVCVEGHPEVRQGIVEYFARHGYVVASKYLEVDDLNLWFVPRGTVMEPFPASVSE